MTVKADPWTKGDLLVFREVSRDIGYRVQAVERIMAAMPRPVLGYVCPEIQMQLDAITTDVEAILNRLETLQRVESRAGSVSAIFHRPMPRPQRPVTSGGER